MSELRGGRRRGGKGRGGQRCWSIALEDLLSFALFPSFNFLRSSFFFPIPASSSVESIFMYSAGASILFVPLRFIANFSRVFSLLRERGRERERERDFVFVFSAFSIRLDSNGESFQHGEREQRERG